MTTNPGVASSARITPLTRDTLQEQVYRQMCDLILDGRLAPGETITVQGLADAFGVSPMPVREALKRLTAADALAVVSGRSVGVAPLSRERLTDLRNVRLEIEPIAAGWGVARASAADIAAGQQHLAEVEAAEAAGDRRRYLRGNHALHFTIYRASGSAILMRIIEDLWLQISPYFHKLGENYPEANTHHREMIEAFSARDEAAVRRALCADIEAAYECLMEQLVDR
ncbi:DNA-binding GntR family transcriptional regulator [Amaricoccus macauensis]|uniref:DNA-binding GntR family transcriptional regulator n=1 Tax=Amaricoccus macauensis TaxID=57001 RepID=A0A840SSI7_9RHOB|nr:GntR family transcriptional regulator [Amaricoccus macauensis]MBB5222776.1 DNA-binding GntR family transcriptional regulator [Amaricoccus macauensis]